MQIMKIHIRYRSVKMSIMYTVAIILMLTITVTSHTLHKPIFKLYPPKITDIKCSINELNTKVNIQNCSSDFHARDFMKENESCWVTLKQSEDEKDTKHLLDVFSKVEKLKCIHGRWSGTDSSLDRSHHRSKRWTWALTIFSTAVLGVACGILCRSGDNGGGGTTVVYKAPPKFNEPCRPADLQEEYNPASGQTSVAVTWATPIATDTDSSTAPIVTQDEGLSSGSSFKGTVSGKQHMIRYKAKDSDGLTADCYFSFIVKVLSCSSVAQPSNGNVDCQNGHSLGSSCAYNCNDGYLISGDATVRCKNAALPTWSAAPTCERIECSVPATLINGYVECEDTSYMYSSVCTYNCNNGYRLQGNLYIQCDADGQWTSSDQPTCIDDIAPTLECVTPQTFYADRGLATTSVTWELPTVTDTIDTAPILHNTVGPTIGSTLEIGTAIVKYKASDSAGNESPECTLEIRVEEIKCSHPLDTLNDNNMAFNCSGVTYSYGDTCTLTCNYNLPLNGTNIITCEKEGPDDNPTGIWDWRTGHQPICEEIECPALDPPLNGLLVDNTINQRPVSFMMCNANHDIPKLQTTITFSGIFFCFDDGTWGPLSYVPDCSEERSPRFISLPSEIFYYSGDCNSAETQEQIRQNFHTILNSTLAQKCPSVETCYVGEMTIRCGPTSGRKKRDLNDLIQGRSIENEYNSVTEDKNPSKHYLVRRQTDETHLLVIEFLINVLWVRGNMSASDAYDHYDDIQLLELKPAIQSLINNGTVDIADFSLKTDSFQTATYGSLVCGDGEYLDIVDCMPCPAGHYLVDNNCTRCPVGTYMDEVGSVQCTSCPDGFTTQVVGSKSSTDCLEFCSMGYYSPDGLAKCSACPVGTYQDQYQSTNCTQCSIDKTTLSTNSSSASDCQNFDVRFSNSLGEDVTIFNMSNSLSNMAVMLWAKPQGLDTNMALTVTSRSSDFIKIHLTTDIHVEVLATESEMVGSFVSSKWTHIAINVDSTSSKISVYVDGVLMHEFNGITISAPYIENGSVVVSSTRTSGVHFSGFHLQNDKVSLSNIESQFQECHITSIDDVISMDVFRTLKTQGITTVVPSVCDAIDECTTSPCGSNTCINEVGGFMCVCSGGYTGDTCTIPPDYCINNKCVSGSTCQSRSTNYTCVCNIGYSGTFCEIAPVNGNWSNWSAWTECAVTCGSGTQSRVRSCDSPSPGIYGLDCVGDSSETVACNTDVCPECPYLERNFGTLLNCTTDSTGTKTCTPYCNDGLLIPEGMAQFDTYRCGVVTNYKWQPIDEVPSCGDANRPQRYSLNVTVDYTPTLNDDDTTLVINAVKANVATTDCGQTSTCQISTEVTTSSRNTLTLSFDFLLVQTDSLQLQQYITDETVSSSLQEVIDAITVLESTAAYINTSSSSIFDVTVNGVTYVSDVNSEQIVATVTCDTGLVATEGLCVQCPVGNYVSGSVCSFCDVGTYQPLPGQTECITCPTGVTTITMGSTDISQCSEPSVTSTRTTSTTSETSTTTPFTTSVTSTTTPSSSTTTTASQKHDKHTKGTTDPEPIGMYIGIGIAVIALMLSVIAISIVCFKKQGKKPLRSTSVSSFDNISPTTGTMSGLPVQEVAAVSKNTVFYHADKNSKPNILIMDDIEKTYLTTSCDSPQPPYSDEGGYMQMNGFAEPHYVNTSLAE